MIWDHSLLDRLEAVAWDYTAWVPDAVVMLIGPNDELRDEMVRDRVRATDVPHETRACAYLPYTAPSTRASTLLVWQVVGGNKFVKKYTTLLEHVATSYADAKTKPAIIA
jgi:hypothetical protein